MPKNFFQIFILTLVCGLAFMEPASATPVTDNIGGVLQKIIDLLTGVWGTSIAIIAVVITGFGWMFGGLDIRKAFFIIIGIALVFGAPQIVNMVQGK